MKIGGNTQNMAVGIPVKDFISRDSLKLLRQDNESHPI